jgi:RHS repeat-associated protein
LLDDTVLPTVPLDGGGQREACRALKGQILRKEVYAKDESLKAHIPYSVEETSFTIVAIQPLQDAHQHSVFYVHPRESITYHFERDLSDPRIEHEMTLDVDDFGNVLRSVRICYGRKLGMTTLSALDKEKQETPLFLYSLNDFTIKIDGLGTPDYHGRISSEVRQYQLSGLQPPNSASSLFSLSDFSVAAIASLTEIPYEKENDRSLKQKRLVKRSRKVYRRDDLTGLLPLGQIEPTVVPGADYDLAFTPGLLATVFQSKVDEFNGREAGYVDLDSSGHWWRLNSRISFHPDPAAMPAQELAEARGHFYMARRFTDAFGNSTTVSYDDNSMFPVLIQDPVENVTTAIMDYRALKPKILTDANSNQSAAAYDALGFVSGTAFMGKLKEGDNLDEFKADLTQTEIDEFFVSPTGPLASNLLRDATTRIIYDFDRYWRKGPMKPSFTATLARETHSSLPVPADGLKLQVKVAYSDGFGRVVQTKAATKAGRLLDDGPVISDRWVGSGWTIFNNKGMAVKQYEPFFDDTHDFKYNMKAGVTSTVFYDPLSRAVANLRADKALEKVKFEAWSQTSYDTNDNVLVANPKFDIDVGPYVKLVPDHDCLPSWHQARISGQLGSDEQATAIKTALHSETPMTVHLDVMGRKIMKVKDNGSGATIPTRSTFDILDNEREVRDATNRVVVSREFDMCGAQIHQKSMDSGERWTVTDAMNQIVLEWNSRGFRHRSMFDANRRLICSFIREGSGNEMLVVQYLYGELDSDAMVHNLRGKVHKVMDQAGILTSKDYDFKGNLLSSERQLAVNYRETLDWSKKVEIADGTYASSTTYDALNRQVQRTSADKSIAYRTYNKTGHLEQLRMNFHGELTTEPSFWTPFITSTSYNARNQVTQIDYGNGASTTYTYDRLLFRLSRIQTMRPSRTGRDVLQDLNYTYDPAGNTTHIQDNAQQDIYFRNTRVKPSSDYTYDAIYRLTSATGREHLGQAQGPTAPTAFDSPSTSLDHPGDGNAMSRYSEAYVYDKTDNITEIKHAGSDASKPGWSRTLAYDPSSNRLTATAVGGIAESYSYDDHGNMKKMPHVQQMSWDFLDQLQSSSQQIQKSGGTPERTYYVYDATGQRIRKVTERQAAPGVNPTRMKERLYIGSSELYREYIGDGMTTSAEIETLHIMGEEKRVGFAETRIQDESTNTSAPFIRYQYDNAIGSSVLELDSEAAIISYEEYTPYGSTSYQGVRSQIETAKRYRYIGMERDEESGLSYFGARYYAPWICRWISPDPAGVRDNVNVYCYVRANPIRFSDPEGTQSKEPNQSLKEATQTQTDSSEGPMCTDPGPNQSTAKDENANATSQICSGDPVCINSESCSIVEPTPIVSDTDPEQMSSNGPGPTSGATTACDPSMNEAEERKAAMENHEAAVDKEMRKLNAKQLANARIIAGVARELQLGTYGCEIGIGTAMQESQLYNLANQNVPESMALPHEFSGHNFTSVGLFQQLNAYGSAAARLDPENAAKMFFAKFESKEVTKKLGGSWIDAPRGKVAQAVQGSAFPDAYDQHFPAAIKICERLY